MVRVLTIEDDETTAREIVVELTQHGFEVDSVADGREGLMRAASGNYDIITLDRMLPGLDGLAILRVLRESGVDTPVLMISALSDVDERVRGLRAGGDDYLTKPFATDEMAARLEVLLRRKHRPERQSIVRVADLEFDLITREVKRAGQSIRLLPTEMRLLEFLMRNAGQVVTRTMIFEAVWGYHFDPGTNLIDVHLGRLRRKVDPPAAAPLIRTIRGAGIAYVPIREFWRTARFRQTLIYGAMFAAILIGMLGLIYAQTAGYLGRQSDQILVVEAAAMRKAPAENLPARINQELRRDPRHISLYGLFSRDGVWITGNVRTLPAIPMDGAPRELGAREGFAVGARALAVRLPWGEVLVVGRITSQLGEFRRIIISALAWSGGLMVVIGLVAGAALSVQPLRRIQAIRDASVRVAQGDLGVRLPIAGRHDELDMLAGIVNAMMDEIERLVGEAKSAGDVVAP